MCEIPAPFSSASMAEITPASLVRTSSRNASTPSPIAGRHCSAPTVTTRRRIPHCSPRAIRGGQRPADRQRKRGKYEGEGWRVAPLSPAFFARSAQSQICDEFGLPPAARNRIEDQAAGDREERQQHQPGREHGGRQARHQALLDAGDENRDGEPDRAKGECDAKRAEKLQRPLATV